MIGAHRRALTMMRRAAFSHCLFAASRQAIVGAGAAQAAATGISNQDPAFMTSPLFEAINVEDVRL